MAALCTFLLVLSLGLATSSVPPVPALATARLRQAAPEAGVAVVDLGSGRLLLVRVGDELGDSGWRVGAIRADRLELSRVAGGPGAERLWLEMAAEAPGGQRLVSPHPPRVPRLLEPVSGALPGLAVAPSEGSGHRSDVPPTKPPGPQS